MNPAGDVRVPTEFSDALESLRSARISEDVRLREIPAPARLAPFALALAGELAGPGPQADDDEPAATGRFVVLYDPAGQDVWEGRFRVVTMVRAALEPDLARDPLLPEVAWTWLREGLEHSGAGSRAAGGTVTRVISESFGSLVGRPEADEIEVRASWTPLTSDLAPHLDAWAHLVGAAAGRPPLPEGVTPLRARRGGGL
ncbi:DUF3000 domain-containing protein [Luteimicrobium subarcticum]|uniref:DUF3000 family protein n=1 Tax=Luteimicrobium subarcticum TaxID=620910 RepID=A0A2M8W432_9MICO|nr:DUF3000 domain-containing protein [Luteimicrobium subarcticum]PJI85681.1 Protein of unknown function (DUF3000) [Luteimicrobium subarcticum]